MEKVFYMKLVDLNNLHILCPFIRCTVFDKFDIQFGLYIE